MIPRFPTPKDPGDIAWYSVDVAGEVVGDTVATVTSSAPAGLEIETQNTDGTKHRMRLKGGTDGSIYPLQLVIVTTSGQRIERTVELAVNDR